MRYGGVEAFLSRGPGLGRGPVAVILAEDEVEVASTLRHHLQAGFADVVLLARPDLQLDPADEGGIHRIDYDVHQPAALPDAVNRMIRKAPGVWFYAGHSAEYLFHPFCETRTVCDLVAFHAEERRDAMLCHVIDLYAADLGRFPDAVSLETAQMDSAGYHGTPRLDPAQEYRPAERQVDIYGGLRWRFAEHVPHDRRRIDRIALFRAKPGLEMRPDFTFSDPEYNTVACQWHHNVTAAVCSFRTAKALRTNPGSREAIGSFLWPRSVPFDWTSAQLMDLGMMEPGQWF